MINGECVCYALPTRQLPHIPVPPPAPTVGAWPSCLAIQAWLKNEGTGVADHLDRASLGLGICL